MVPIMVPPPRAPRLLWVLLLLPPQAELPNIKGKPASVQELPLGLGDLPPIFFNFPPQPGIGPSHGPSS